MPATPIRFHPARAALAGLAASAAYVAEMYLDIAVTGSRVDDLQLIEGALRGRDVSLPALGLALHLANGAALGEVFAAVESRLPGPGWVRGLLFGELFLVFVWSGVPLLDRYHPLIRRGALPKLASRTAFAQNLVRHAVFGATLGVLYHR